MSFLDLLTDAAVRMVLFPLVCLGLLVVVAALAAWCGAREDS